MTKLIVVKCPQCGADLQLEEGRKTAYCSYCGAKILIENENEHIIRHIDEAEVRRAEAEEKIKLKSLELEEQEGKNDDHYITIWLGSLGILILLGIIGFAVDNAGMMFCLIFAMMDGVCGLDLIQKHRHQSAERKSLIEGKIKLPESDFSRTNVHSVERMFRGLGFTNIQLINLKDLTTGWIYKPGMVESVSIGGHPAEENKWYYHDDIVVITYHNYAK